MNEPRYWTWDELRSFLTEHDLMIAEGPDYDDAIAMTGKGAELFMVLGLMKQLADGAAQ